MPSPRKIRYALVEYQPNLQVPADPVKLGILVEEIRGSVREWVLIGREPGGPIPGMELDDAWGPFLTVVTQWVEILSKSIREFIGDLPSNAYVVDELARRWNANLYVTQPEVKAVTGKKTTLEQYASRWYASSVEAAGRSSPVTGRNQRRRRRPTQKPWISRRSAYLAEAQS